MSEDELCDWQIVQGILNSYTKKTNFSLTQGIKSSLHLLSMKSHTMKLLKHNAAKFPYNVCKEGILKQGTKATHHKRLIANYIVTKIRMSLHQRMHGE